MQLKLESEYSIVVLEFVEKKDIVGIERLYNHQKVSSNRKQKP